MKIKKAFIVLFIFCFAVIPSFSSVISMAAANESSENNKETLTDPPVIVEYVRDPIPIPRRNIVFFIRSDEGLQETNFEITYTYGGKTINYDEGSVEANPAGTAMCVELPYYGFFEQGKINVRLWNNDPVNHFDWSFPAKTFGIFCYVCLF